ncbi:fungal-specific transcription factor domain-containing protein [Podospora australis]|uniref:Fungal-specific transcription factor domain-containing protein n=1 Tax=Podospora australis TaxID=1536484 RepID=A0AAN6WN72_9PEZI|nr:fungal-specific transcription factor domain-containing protein [Podospora australis]
MGEPERKRTKYAHTSTAAPHLATTPPFSEPISDLSGFFLSPLQWPSTGLLTEHQWGSPNIEALYGSSQFGSTVANTTPPLADRNPQLPWSPVPTFGNEDLASTSNTGVNLFSDAFSNVDIWSNTSLYQLGPRVPLSLGGFEAVPHATPRKRALEKLSEDLFSVDTSSTAENDFLQCNFPALFPSVPDRAERPSFQAVRNPFLESSENRHPTLENRVRPSLPNNGVINGYIKIQMSAAPADDGPIESEIWDFRSTGKRWLLDRQEEHSFLWDAIPPLPRNFATGMNLDMTDQKLWGFHLHAFCPGRMLLPENYWSSQVAAIAVTNKAARHALLAFATAYALDYQPTETMRERANHHYRSAVRLIEEALQREETYSPGNEDGIVAAIILVLSNDIVNWESRRPKGLEPLWREGARAGRLVLDQSDPGYRYWKNQNVQCTPARTGNANWIAYTDICAQPVTPLSEENAGNRYSWLLAGSEKDVHRIQGITGLCPKLLHIFSQITHLAALLSKNPDGEVVRCAAIRIRKRLKSLRQWCEGSDGYDSADKLLESCILDDNGKVNDALKVVELSAHAWVPAAEIYLHCRVYRKPRSHPHVLAAMDVLVQCVKRLPCTGELFTSQSPFFPVTLMAMLSYREDDRKVSRDWFEVVLTGAQCRSSVPPVWDAIKELWGWWDNEVIEPAYDEDQLMGHRDPWWETMVEKLVEHSGVLSLV